MKVGLVANLTKLQVSKAVLVMLLLCAFFPYVKTSSMDSDTQPHFIVALVIGLIMIFIARRGVFISWAMLSFSILYAVLAIILAAPASDVISIITLFLSMWLLAKLARMHLELIASVLKFVIVVYFLVGLAQVLGVGVFDSWVSNIRTSDERGVPSLASEPSFFGLLSLAVIVVLEVCSKGGARLYQAIGVLCIVMSASLTAILPAIIVIFAYALARVNARGAIYVTLFVGGGVVAVGDYTGRASMLVDLAINNPDLFLQDASLINRLSRSFGALVVAYDEGFRPHSFSGLAASLSNSTFSELDLLGGDVERLSNIGSIFIYGFGVMTIPLLLFLTKLRKKILTPPYLGISIVVFITANISIATPYVALILLAPRILYIKECGQAD